MSREYPLRPIVGVGAVILQGEEVLLVRRGKPPRAGQWSLPGGAVETGESLEEACRREILEETGLSIELLSRCAVLDRITRDEWDRVRYHYVLINYACRPTGGVLSASSDISEARWYPLSEIPSLDAITPITARVILETVESLHAQNISF
ncbi:MAG: NUDIX hydrolase [bacterium]|nr:NUDIX hydrolase [bacterium]